MSDAREHISKAERELQAAVECVGDDRLEAALECSIDSLWSLDEMVALVDERDRLEEISQ